MKHALGLLAVVSLSACGGPTGPAGGSGLPQPTDVTAQALSSGQIRVRWTAPVVVAALSYDLVRDGTKVATVTATEATDEGLEAGQEYCYAVVAVDEIGRSSAASDVACATTPDGWSLRAGGTSMVLSAVAAKDGRVVALGNEQRVLTSDDDGASWSVHSAAGLGSSWYYATTEPPWSDLTAFAGLFVATSGIAHTLYTSADGLSWTQRLSSTADLLALATSPSPPRIVAVGLGGVIHWSNDGLTWGAATSGTTADLVGVAWTGSYFVALTQTGQLLRSLDGTSWTPMATSLTSATCIASSGKRSVVMGDRVAYSTNAIDWTYVAAPTLWVRACAWSTSSGKFVAATDDGVWASADGVTWTKATGDAFRQLTDVTDTGTAVVAVGEQALVARAAAGATYAAAFTGAELNGVEWMGDRFAAVGGDGMILFSTDGITWTHRSSGDSTDLLWNAASGGGRWVVGGQSVIVASTDGASWQRWYAGAYTQAYAVAHTGTAFLSAQTDGIGRSVDGGTTWTRVYASYPDQPRGLVVGGPRLVAVGNPGLVLTSTDETTWTKGTTGSTASLEAVAWSGSRFVAVGEGGTILGSPDGLSWTAATSGVTATLHDVTWTGTEFVACGDGNTVLTSPDGLMWSRGPATDSTTRALNGVASHAGRTVVVSSEGRIYTM